MACILFEKGSFELALEEGDDKYDPVADFHVITRLQRVINRHLHCVFNRHLIDISKAEPHGGTRLSDEESCRHHAINVIPFTAMPSP